MVSYNKMRHLLTISIISIILSSCNSDETSKNYRPTEKQQAETDNSQNQKDTFCIYIDTLHQVELKSLKNDNLKFSQFYEVNSTPKLIYHEKGKINTDNSQFGLSVYSVNDTTIRVELLKSSQNEWQKCDSLNLFNVSFSPAMFYPLYYDFNKSGINDILLIFSQSMSVAYSHGHLILFSEEYEKLTLIENSFDIPNLGVANNKIVSVTYNHQGNKIKEYEKTDEYEILENTLILVKSNKKYK